MNGLIMLWPMGLADDKYTGYNWINLVSGEIST